MVSVEHAMPSIFSDDTRIDRVGYLDNARLNAGPKPGDGP